MPDLTSTALRAALAKLNLPKTTIDSALGDVRVFDRTPPGDPNARLVLWLSQHEWLTTEEDGLENVPTYSDDLSILQKTHLVFIDDQHIALMYNQAGPKLSDLTNYLSSKLPELGKIQFRPLQAQNKQQLLDRMEDINYVRIKTKDRMVAFTDPEKASEYSQFRATSERMHATEFDIALKGDGAGNFGQRAKRLMRDLVSVENASEFFQLLGWKGRDPQGQAIREVDLFKDKLFRRRSIGLDSNRVITDDRAFQIILEEYDKIARILISSTPIEISGQGLEHLHGLINQLATTTLTSDD